MNATLPPANALPAAGGLARRDLAYGLIAAVLILALGLRFDLAATLFDTARLSSTERPDELLFAGFVLCIVLLWYSGRRWRDAARERALRKDIAGLLDGAAAVPPELPRRIIDSVAFLAAAARALDLHGRRRLRRRAGRHGAHALPHPAGAAAELRAPFRGR